MNASGPQIAYFITPHGFGHGARAAACMVALDARIPHIGWHIFTQVPEWFFGASGIATASYHALATDVGLVQCSPWEADMAATLALLEALLPFRPQQVAALAETVKAASCRLIICDIAALGIAVARKAGLPAVLVENFTWDWIYAPHVGTHPQIGAFGQILAQWYARADHHIQAAPWCASPPAPPDLQTGPVSRPAGRSRDAIRRALKIPKNHRLLLVTMGGVPDRHERRLKSIGLNRISLVIPGNHPQVIGSGALIRLPYHSRFYHPDLIQAADAVVGKAGYSTLAEVYRAGVPFGYIARDNFRESAVLSRFIEEEMKGREISADFWDNPADWQVVETLVSQPRRTPRQPNGAGEIARYLQALLED